MMGLRAGTFCFRGLWLAVCLLSVSTGSWAFANQDQEAKGLASFSMGVFYDLQGEPGRAIEEFERSARIAPNAVIHLRLGADYARLGKLDEAIQSLQQALEFDPQSIPSRYLLALIYSSKKDFDKAAQEYEMILTSFQEADPKNLEIYGFLGQLYYSQRKYQKALEQFEKVLKVDPQDTDVMFLVGSLYLELNDKARAKEIFRKAIAINPRQDGCLNSLGYLYAQDEENLQEAKSLVERAIAIDPENGAYLDSLGWIYFKEGDYRKALEVFEEADRYMKDPVIYEHIGDVYYKMNRIDDAKRYWSLSLELLPGQQQVLQKLETLN